MPKTVFCGTWEIPQIPQVVIRLGEPYKTVRGPCDFSPSKKVDFQGLEMTEND